MYAATGRYVHVGVIMTDRVTVVRDTEIAMALVTRLTTLRGELRIGGYSFPSRTQYLDAVSEEGGPEAHNIAAIQKAWFITGQSGCTFARLAAKAKALHWTHVVWQGEPGADAAAVVDGFVDQLTREDEVQIVSIVLPSIGTAGSAIDAIDALVSAGEFWIERSYMRDDLFVMHVRRPVRAETVQAWVMAFGPFEFMPNTRRSPYFQLTLRVKPKPEWLFERLNHDPSAAHLADVPLQMASHHWEHRWQTTLRRTRRLLGANPDEITAAKATIAVPLDELNAKYLRATPVGEETPNSVNILGIPT